MNQPINVLVVEDSLDDFFLLKSVLDASEEIEARIVHADRLESALSAGADEDFDVAIIDLSLPDSLGLDTYLFFRDRFPLIPTIIMTGIKDHALAFEAIQEGAQDYLFKGEPSSTAIIRIIRYAIERQRLTTQLKTALEHVKQLQGLLPICSVCKKIRDDKGYWNRIETYISKHSEIQFSHGLCPGCAQKLYPDLCLPDHL
ncbi:MAG: response regulator [Desulfosarcina sp.]